MLQPPQCCSCALRWLQGHASRPPVLVRLSELTFDHSPRLLRSACRSREAQLLGACLKRCSLLQVKQDQITKLVVIPLYPQFSISTSASSLRLFEQMLETDPALQGLSHIVIASWYWRNGYLEAMTGLIAKELQSFEDPQTVQVST